MNAANSRDLTANSDFRIAENTNKSNSWPDGGVVTQRTANPLARAENCDSSRDSPSVRSTGFQGLSTSTANRRMVAVLVCGGRDMDAASVWNWLEANAADYVGAKISRVIHGAARGADEGARLWAESEEGCSPVAYPADWKKHGKAAGPIRNQRMLDEAKPDVVIAFPGGRGTADMVRRARAAGVRVIEVSA